MVRTRKQPRTGPIWWRLAQANALARSHRHTRIRPPIGARRASFGLRLSGEQSLRIDFTWRRDSETRTPPGIRTPEMMAPSGGTTRASPTGVAGARRSVSFTTAVYQNVTNASPSQRSGYSPGRGVAPRFHSRAVGSDWARRQEVPQRASRASQRYVGGDMCPSLRPCRLYANFLRTKELATPARHASP